MTQASAPMTDKRILIAKIAQSHGVRGLVKLHLYTDTPEILDTATLYKGEHGKDTIKLILKNPMGKYWLAEIDGITDRTAADHLRHQEIWIDRDALPPVDENEFYYDDLIDMAVIDDQDRTTQYGTIISVSNFGASDLIEIKPQTGHSYYLPFTDEYVPEIDMDARIAYVIIPEGLRDD